jgi:large subunit ribosomal protein L10
VNRAEKETAVEQMNRAFAASPHVVLTSFTGLTVNQASDLRQRIRRAGGRFTVLKNRLAKRAATGTPVEPLAGRLRGPCGLAMHGSDAVGLAKILADFSKENPQLELLAGIVDAKEVLEGKDVRQLAALPGLPELRAQLLRVVQAPATSLVRLLATPGTQVARVLSARSETSESA